MLEHSEILICVNHMCECQRVFLSLQIGSGRENTQVRITTDKVVSVNYHAAN
jgi:hypothetical protein